MMPNEYTPRERFKVGFREMIPYYSGIDEIWISEETEQDVTWPELEPIPAGHLVIAMSDHTVRDGGLVSDFIHSLYRHNQAGDEDKWVQDEEEWLAAIKMLTRHGQSNGLAELDGAGTVPASQLPSYVDDVIEGYGYPIGDPPDYTPGNFYKDAAHTQLITGETGKIYADLVTHKIYRWTGSLYVLISRATDVLNDEIVKDTDDSHDFTWTVQKLMSAFKSYNPEFFESISMGRVANSAQGSNSTAIGTSVTAAGENSVAEGEGTIANGKNQHVFGKYNVADSTSLEIVGKGTSSTRSNARTLDANGNEWLAGNLQIAKNLSVGGTTSLTGKVTASNDVDIAQNLEVTGTINGKKFSSVIPYHEYVTDNDVPTNKAVEDYIVAWFDYEQIAVSSLSVTQLTVSPAASENGSLVEKGSTVTKVRLNYTLTPADKDGKVTATAMKLDGTATKNDNNTMSSTGTITRNVSLNNTNKTWTLYVEDTRPDGSHKSASKNVTLSFVNRVFYGAAAIPSTINSSFVRGLSNSVLDADGIVSGISITTGANQYMWYCSTNNKCKFNVGGFDGGFEPAVSVSVKDAGNTDTTYYVYRSTNPNLGTKTVTVK